MSLLATYVVRDGGRGAQRRVLARCACLALLAFLAVASSARAEMHTFKFDARSVSPRPKAVYIAGTFNGWAATAQPMQDDGSGVYTWTADLPDGVTFYKFVLDGNRWVNDPNDDKELRDDDGNGGMNSAVLIGFDARKLPRPTDGSVVEQGIKFDRLASTDFNVVSNTQAQLSLRVQAGGVQEAFAWVNAPNAPNGWKPFRMVSGDTVLGLERLSTVVPIGDRPLRWEFELRNGKRRFFYHTEGLVESKGDLADAPYQPDKAFSSPAKLTFSTPDWAKHAVWYQIFPERFRNGDKSNDPGDGPDERLIKWTADWWKTQPGEVPGESNFYNGAGNVWKRRYGGDIQGIQQELPYLRSLGVTAIYLNPIFEATSMHKYDTRDYRHVDQHFTVRENIPLEGETDDPATWKWSKGDLVFLDFVKEAHRQGFKVILDGVFNHVGRDHPFFQDLCQKGAASKFANWFIVDKWPDKLPADPALFGKPGGLSFKAWDGPSGHLPALRKDDEHGLADGPYGHIMAITRRWMAPNGNPKDGIDGWRLDAANEVPHAFWIDWRREVKRLNPDAYISGEIWSPAQPWLGGDQFDGVMNYQFAMAGQKFFVNQSKASTPAQFAKELIRLQSLYPLQSVMVLQNLYDSHDTDRLASMFVNPDRNYDAADRIQDNGPDYSPAKPKPQQWERMRQAATFQMTFIGAPMIYYGDEVGMWSPDDPSDRMPMVWKDLEPYDDKQVKFDDAVFKTYQRAIAVRRALPELQTGYMHPVYADDATGVIAFDRDLDGRDAVVIVNRSAQPRTVTVPAPSDRVVDWMDDRTTELDDADGRPLAKLKPTAPHLEAKAGKIRVTVRPWGTAVLAAPQGAAK